MKPFPNLEERIKRAWPEANPDECLVLWPLGSRDDALIFWPKEGRVTTGTRSGYGDEPSKPCFEGSVEDFAKAVGEKYGPEKAAEIARATEWQTSQFRRHQREYMAALAFLGVMTREECSPHEQVQQQ